MRNRAVRTVFAQIHLWLGLALGLYWLMLGVTGSLLVFGREIDRTLEASVLTVRVPADTSKRAPLSVILARFRERHPNAVVKYILYPRTPDGVHSIRLGEASPSQRYIYQNPYTGEIVGERTRTSSLYGTLCYLHFYLAAGQKGWEANGWGAILSTMLLISGLVLWWPTARGQWRVRLSVRWRGGYKKLVHDLHNVTGVYPLIALLIFSLTAIEFAFSEQVKGFVYTLTRTPKFEKPKVPSPANPGAQRLDVDTLVARGDAAYDGRLYRVNFPQKPTEPFVVRKEWNDWNETRNNVEIYLNPFTGQILHIKDTRRARMGEQIVQAIIPLHFGLWGGLPTRILYVFLGLSPVVLAVTGFLKWKVKRDGQRALKFRRATAQAAPGGVSTH